MVGDFDGDESIPWDPKSVKFHPKKRKFTNPSFHGQVEVPEKIHGTQSIKNWMGPNPNGPLSKLLGLLDTQV